MEKDELKETALQLSRKLSKYRVLELIYKLILLDVEDVSGCIEIYRERFIEGVNV